MSEAVPATSADWSAGLTTMLAVDARGLPPRLLELIRLWCSLLNDCAFRKATYWRKEVALSVSMTLLGVLFANRDTSGLDDYEHAAFAFASAQTALESEAVIRDAKAALVNKFDRSQIVTLRYVVARIHA